MTGLVAVAVLDRARKAWACARTPSDPNLPEHIQSEHGVHRAGAELQVLVLEPRLAPGKGIRLGPSERQRHPAVARTVQSHAGQAARAEIQGSPSPTSVSLRWWMFS